jgi:GNAT superfamily N-acetyltransferase
MASPDHHSNCSLLPGGYILRPAGLADLDTILCLRVAQNRVDYGMDGLTETLLRESWSATDFHPGLDHWLVFAPGGKPMAYAEVRDDGDGDFELILAMDPELWADSPPGPAAAQHLLKQTETRAREVTGERGYRLSCRLGTRNEAACRSVETCGFHKHLTFLIMEAGLTQPPAAPVLPDGVTIRTFIPGEDDQVVYRADEEASEDKGYHQPLSYDGWCRRMGRDTPYFDPGLWLLAFMDGELAGAALNFYEPGSRTAWVDHLGTRRAFRKRGIGMALLAHSLNVFYQRGYPTARLSVDSHSLTHAPRLYEKAGFQTVMGYHIYRK